MKQTDFKVQETSTVTGRTGLCVLTLAVLSPQPIATTAYGIEKNFKGKIVFFITAQKKTLSVYHMQAVSPEVHNAEYGG